MTSTFTAISVVARWLTLATALIACTSETTFRSTTNHVDPAKIERVVVVASFGAWFTDGMKHGFEAGLADKLTSCGVRSVILMPDPVALDVERGTKLAMVTLGTSNLLRIQGSYDLPLNHTERVLWERLPFSMVILDTQSNHLTWSAQAALLLHQNDIAAPRETGARFATQIASQLRHDGVLNGCPAQAATWAQGTPDPRTVCEGRRRQVLEEARQIQDPQLRMDMIRSMPVCQ